LLASNAAVVGHEDAVCPGSKRVHPEYATSLIGNEILDTPARSAPEAFILKR
jgi:hypothetical protein